jgi:hypothetical protein
MGRACVVRSRTACVPSCPRLLDPCITSFTFPERTQLTVPFITSVLAGQDHSPETLLCEAQCGMSLCSVHKWVSTLVHTALCSTSDRCLAARNIENHEFVRAGCGAPRHSCTSHHNGGQSVYAAEQRFSYSSNGCGMQRQVLNTEYSCPIRLGALHGGFCSMWLPDRSICL